MNRFLVFVVFLFLPVLATFNAHADDTDLYVLRNGGVSNYRPQLLIIFDNSGSMGTEVESAPPNYDPHTNYVVPDSGSNSRYQYNDNYVYYLPNGSVPSKLSNMPSANTFEYYHRYFPAAINSCDTAKNVLAITGTYTGVLKYVKFSGRGGSRNGSWDKLPSSSRNSINTTIDCLDDFVKSNDANAAGFDKGYPKSSFVRSGGNYNPFTSNFDYSSDPINKGDSAYDDFDGSRAGYTLYSANYLRYVRLVNNGTLTETRTRIEIAKDAITGLMNSSPSVDYGVMAFNYNVSSNTNGGRVISKLEQRADLTPLINQINGLSAQTNTPLCETTYEAMRYLAGDSVLYGNQNNSYYYYLPVSPPKDGSAESNGTYLSPFKSCQSKLYVVMITDGEPTQDTDANSRVTSLPGFNGTKVNNSYLPALAQWMHTHDINPHLAGTQTIDMYTIGFALGTGSAAEPILQATANLGGGRYYSAQQASDLIGALQNVVAEVSSKSSSFTSPSIAANNFDRTRSLDSIYYAMFLPSPGPFWAGNLKKLKVTNDDDIVDVNGVSAVTASGDIDENATTFWSAEQDGNNTTAGGVNEALRTQASSNTRKLLTTTPSGIEPLTVTNLAKNTQNNQSDLATDLGMPEAELQPTIDWLKGVDVDDVNVDGSTTDIRTAVMGDPLHSKPLAINYGASGNTNDVRLLVGTNQGAIHMFEDNGNTVTENWALFPFQEMSKAYTLRENDDSTSKVYSMDGSPVAYVYDHNDNGVVETGDGDKVWAFIGQRRGGHAYYGLNISDPDNPVLMWRIDNASAGFSEMGQTWSPPTVAKIPGHTGPVLIVGAGYDPGTDTAAATSASSGRGIFIIDAATGNLVWSATPAATSGTNLHADFTASFPSKIATLDSDRDGLVDRLYATDTAGNVWRIDLPSSNPFDTTNPWTVSKLAALGGTNNTATDRRFYASPTVVQTQYTQTVTTSVTDAQGNTTSQVTTQLLPFDAVLVGSGKRPEPLSTQVNNKLFMLRDTEIVSHSHPYQSNAYFPIGAGDLYDMSGQPFAATMTNEERQSQELALGTSKGWFYNLTHSGEKSLSSPLVIDGVAYFTTFTPPGSSQSEDACLVPGMGRLYALDLHHGFNAYNWGVVDIPGKMPDTPVVHAGVDKNGKSVIRVIGVGRIDNGDGSGSKPTLPINMSMAATRIYYYVGEQ